MRQSYVVFLKINSTDSCPSTWIQLFPVALPLNPHPGGDRRKTPVLAARIGAGVITLIKETFSDKVEGTPRQGKHGRGRLPDCRCEGNTGEGVVQLVGARRHRRRQGTPRRVHLPGSQHAAVDVNGVVQVTVATRHHCQRGRRPGYWCEARVSSELIANNRDIHARSSKSTNF